MTISLVALVCIMVIGGIWIMYSQATSVRQIVVSAFRDHGELVVRLTEELRLRDEDHAITVRRLDADYKALVESYLRETGKVYVRPPMDPTPPPPSADSPTRGGGPRAFQFKSHSQIITEREERESQSNTKMKVKVAR